MSALGLGQSSLGLWPGAAVAAWTALAALVLLWPLPPLRSSMAWQAALVGALMLAVESGRWLSGHANTQGATTLGLAAAIAAVGLWPASPFRARILMIRLTAACTLLLSGLYRLGALGPVANPSLPGEFPFDTLLGAAALVLGSSLLRQGLLGGIGIREGIRLAAALALAAAILEAALALSSEPALAPGIASLNSALASIAITAALLSVTAERERTATSLLIALMLAALAPWAWWLLAGSGRHEEQLPLTTGLALGIACFGLISAQRRHQRQLWRSLAWSSGLLIILLAMLGLLGLLLKTDRLNPWGDSQLVHPLASVSHFALGVALVLISESARERRRPLATLLPAALGSMVVALGVLGWMAALPEDAARIERATRTVAGQMQVRIQQRLDQFGREVLTHTTRMDSDDRLPADLEPAIIATADPRGLGWRLRDASLTDTLQRVEPRLQTLILDMSEHAVIEASPLLGAGQPLWMLVSAANQAPGRRTRLLVDVEALLRSALQGPELDFAIELRQGDTTIFSYRTDEASTRIGSVELGLERLGQAMSLRLVPLPETIQLMGSQMPNLILVMGLLLGGTLAAALRLAVLARQRAEQAESTARGLEREVAAREATETALDRSLDEIGLILTSISDGFLFLDRSLKLSFANSQAAKLLGEADELLIGARLADLWPQLADAHQQQLILSAQTQAVTHFEAFNPRSLRWLEMRGFPHPEGIALLLRDITEQRERAQRLALSEATLRGAQKLARVGSWHFDLRSGRWLWSDELYRILGLAPGQLRPSRDLLLQHVPAEQRERLASAFDVLLSEGRELQLEHPIQLPSGERIAALSLARGERDGMNLVTVSGTLQDISSQKRQAAELGAALDRSERQGRQLRALNRVSLLASQKLGAPDLLHVLLTEIRAALGARLIVLLPAENMQDGIGDAMVLDGDDQEEWPNFDAKVQGLLREIGARGPCQLSAVELIAQSAYAELHSELLGLPLAGLLSVPLRQPDGRDLGYLQASNPGPRGFAEDDLEVLMQFGQIVALSLDWARLIDTLKTTRLDLQDQVEQLSRNRALLAGAERVAGLGTWQVRFADDQPKDFEVSEQVRDMLGLDSTAPDLAHVKDLLHSVDRRVLSARFQDLFAGGPALDAEFRIRAADGHLHWIHAQAELSRDGAGRPQHLLGTVRDISRARAAQEREQAKAEVLRSIATGQPLTRSLHALIASLEDNFSRRVAIAYGIDPSLGISDFEAPSLPEEFRRQVISLSRISRIAPSRVAAETLQQVIVEDVLAVDEFAPVHAVCAEAGIRSICATPILTSNDTLLGVLTVYGNEPSHPDPEMLAAISAAVSLAAIAMKTTFSRKRLEESQQRLRSLFTLVPDSVYALDPRGRIEDCNAAAEAASGLRRDYLIGKPITITVPTAAESEMREHVSRAASGSTQRFEHQAVGPGGAPFEAVTTTLPIEVDGDVVGVFLIAADVSEERRAQAALQSALDDVEARNQDLQDFAFVASHDLQEPLRKVQAFGDRLRLHLADRLDADGADYIQRMRNAAARMQTLINDLLAYSRVSRNAQQLQQVHLSKVLSEVLSDLESRIESGGAQIEADPMPVIEADPTQMRQLLQNLLGNALKFAHPERAPRIRLWTESLASGAAGAPPRLRLIIEDNGIGFDSRYQERIFAPFQRLHGRSEYEGSGIGLAIVRKIVERHGGRIRAEGRPGEGARFEIELPIGRPGLSMGAAVCEDSA